MHLSQIVLLSAAISRHNKTESVNTISWARVAYHADAKDYERIIKDLQRT